MVNGTADGPSRVLPPLSLFGTIMSPAHDLEARFSRIGENAGCVSIERARPEYHEAWFLLLKTPTGFVSEAGWRKAVLEGWRHSTIHFRRFMSRSSWRRHTQRQRACSGGCFGEKNFFSIFNSMSKDSSRISRSFADRRPALNYVKPPQSQLS